METINVLSSRQKLGKILEKINPDCYKRRVKLEILSEVLNLLNFGTYNPLYILNELFVIVYDKSDVDSAFKNHVKQVLYHVHTVICENELKKFLNNEPERQTLERATFLFGQCFNHEGFFKIDYQDMSSKIDVLTHKVQSYLMKRNADHPAVSMELLSPDEPLRETRWTEAQSLDLFDCINYVIFEKYNFRKMFRANLLTLHHLLIRERLETEKGGNFTPVLVYMFVCHRLGIFLQLELRECLSLRWTVPNSEREFFIFGNGVRRENVVQHSPLDNNGSKIVSKLLVWRIMETFLIQYFRRPFLADAVLIPTLKLMFLLQPYFEGIFEPQDSYLYEMCIDRELYIEEVITECKKKLQKTGTDSRVFETLLRKAENVLALHESRSEESKTGV